MQNMKNNINIRSATANDIPRLHELYSMFDREPNQPVSAAESSRSLAEMQRFGDVLVALNDGEVVGTCSIYICPTLLRGARPFAVIEHIVINPKHRRNGIGRQLIEAAVKHADSAGCYKIMLMTGMNREENHRFYEACGFVGGKIGFQKRLLD
jgi:GNAT superfamily N-acetyltransferase